MPTNNWPLGIGETTGDALLTAANLLTSGDLIYAHFGTGNDANDGRDRVKPKKTLASAVAAATGLPASKVVLLPGHDETITTAVVLADASAGLMILGSGKIGGKPSVKLKQSTGIATAMITVQGPGITFGNIWFAENVVDLATPKLILDVSPTLADGSTRFRDCLFEMGDHDLGPAIRIATGADFGEIERTAFNCVGLAALQPLTAIQLTAAATVEGWHLEDVSFDGGSTGFSNFYAVDTSAGAGFNRFLFERISLAKGADLRFASGDTGSLNVTQGQLGARVRW